ncbi:S41 family peptidase [Cognatilysobacter tabacisoli]|uniref:S41 family peptidase n=1 Tax=Cognatilysobacter tabacisoli TaxID=2315424 RepID=UPI000E6B2109|nr:S41 family peptidase [Lysobacter tabacisoli]
MRIAVACAVALLLAAPLRAQAPSAVAPKLSANTTFSADALQGDVDVLQQAYEALHPGLHRYNTPEQMRGHFDALRRELSGERTLAQAYLALSKFAGTVRCGHTYANFYNQPEAVRAALFEGRNRVPFHFRWLDGAMVVTRDFTAGRVLPPGTTVTAIDGIDTTELLASLMPYARADGSNDAKRRSLLSVQGDDEWETFDIFLPLVHPQVGARQTLQVRTPGSRTTRTVIVDAVDQAGRLAQRPKAPDGERAGWTFDTTDDGLAVLAMPGWALYDSKWDWKGFLRDSFARIDAAKPRALVIDLRGNEGGLDVGDEILPHLIARELRVPSPERRVRYRKVPDALAPYLDTWDPSFKDWGEQAQPVGDGFYRLVRANGADAPAVFAPRAPRYAGPVFVLVGAANSSATFQFAHQVQRAALATLVGQPTGGNQRGINGGAFFFLRLPNTGIELDLPLIATFPPGQPPDAGLMPDVLVNASAADIAAGRDVEMAAVRAALARRD